MTRTLLTLLALAAAPAMAGERALVDTSDSPHAKSAMVNLDDVTWNGGFWGERFEVLQENMIPYMWELFQDDHESHAWSNYLLAAGLGQGRDGHFHGPPFNDGDFLKWFEAVAQVYAVTRDPELDQLMDRIIEVVGKAQREDGYLHTKTIIPQRQGNAEAKEFEDREHFETYNMGHLITAACVHHRATGKDNMLKLAIKAADYIDRLCEEKPGELALNAICPSHYMAVIELYRLTGEERYKELGKKLIEIRDLVPPEVGSDHNQDRVPFRESEEAAGHAVRANYLYAGVADVVAEHGDPGLLAPLEKIADDVQHHKLAITGMTGALYDGASPDGSTDHPAIKTVHQAYGRDHQLPNLTAYHETCATIGYNLWNWRMLTLTNDARYADLHEQVLFNGVLPGISLEGTHYFYVNPLRKSDDLEDDKFRWSRTRTPNIKSSFCCPPNVLRTIAEVHNYLYTLSEDALWVHLYGASTLETAWQDGAEVKLRQETDYPWSGTIRLVLDKAPAKTLKLRIPGWSGEAGNSLKVNGEAVETDLAPGTYATLDREWSDGDVIELSIGFEPVLYESNPLVEETRNQVAVKYGPLVYCIESNDLPEGVDIDEVALTPDAFADGYETGRMKVSNTEVTTLSVEALDLGGDDWNRETLYRPVNRAEPDRFELTLVPYYAWGNRGDTEMTVWIPLR